MLKVIQEFRVWKKKYQLKTCTHSKEIFFFFFKRRTLTSFAALKQQVYNEGFREVAVGKRKPHSNL